MGRVTRSENKSAGKSCSAYGTEYSTPSKLTKTSMDQVMKDQVWSDVQNHSSGFFFFVLFFCRPNL